MGRTFEGQNDPAGILRGVTVRTTKTSDQNPAIPSGEIIREMMSGKMMFDTTMFGDDMFGDLRAVDSSGSSQTR